MASKKPSEFELGMKILKDHTSFQFINVGRVCASPQCDRAPRHGPATVTSNGLIHVNTCHKASAGEWAWAVAHAELHLGFGHLPAAAGERPQPDAVELAARCAVVNRFLASLKVGSPPPPELIENSTADEEQLIARWRQTGIPDAYARGGTAGPAPDQLLRPWVDPRPHLGTGPPDWTADFARSLARAVTAAIEVAGGARMSMHDAPQRKSAWDLALSWFVSSYPLLGSIASAMRIVADVELARTHGIWIAAVDAPNGDVYINPQARLTTDEWRFVLAHEMLHAALRHADRVGGRDPYLWNVAADYVINHWLVEMGVGVMPEDCLHDPALVGLSAEEVYHRIANDLRRIRKLSTLRGRGVGDILSEPLPGLDGARGGIALDDFYRRALTGGFEYHRQEGRGFLPAGLVEEIKALEQPPLKWDAKLARWFDEFVPRVEPVRNYSRPSRRQSSTPDIPRPGRYLPEEITPRVTFGVVLDTSGSMGTKELGKALGAIASYSLARDVPAARVVYCDAVAHDAGYVPVEEIGGRMRLKGRGGTVLQPAVRLLQEAPDFPPDAPILIITDGYCDVLTVRREHAYLMPAGARLPFKPRGPVFAFR